VGQNLLNQKSKSPDEMQMKKDPKYERQRWTIFLVTYLAYFGFYMTRKAFPVAKIGILNDPSVNLSREVMGLIDGGYGIAYALGQFIWGMSADRFGSRKVVLFGMLSSVLVAIMMGLSSTAIAFGALLFFQGLFQATGWAPLVKNVSLWFSKKERGRIYGIWSSNYALGGMVAGVFAGYMALACSSWRFAFFAPAAVLFLIWILFLLFQKNRPEDAGLPSIEEYHGETDAVSAAYVKSEEKLKSSLSIIRQVFKNPMIIRLAVVYFLLKPVRYTILFWGPLMVSEKLGTNIGESAGISALFEASGILGVYFAGYASDKFFNARRMPIIVIEFFLLALVLFFFDSFANSGSVLLMSILLGVIGFLVFGPDGLISSVSAVDFSTKEGASSTTGVINGFGAIGQIIGLSIPGIVSATFGWGALFTGFGVLILLAALILLPKWNAVPSTRIYK
jgi:OPA family glycerol-3-phosphate transporter-like MFS transporter